jgi:colanic acid/amylovoran biosynthesis glycosyltransferase
LVRELGMSNAVRIVGAGTREEVARSMRAAHLVVAPSVTADDGDMEGIPVALMEAMASGVPVVATRHSGIPELVCHGVSGVLVPERDVKALAAAIQQLVERPQQWLALTRAARQTVEQLHDVEVLNDRLVELLAGQRPTSRRQRVVHSRSTMASGSSVESPPKPHQFPFEPR